MTIGGGKAVGREAAARRRPRMVAAGRPAALKRCECHAVPFGSLRRPVDQPALPGGRAPARSSSARHCSGAAHPHQFFLSTLPCGEA